MRIKNISPVGDLWVPALGRRVKAGEIADVTDEQATELLEQPDNWRATDKEAREVRDAIEDEQAADVAESEE